MPELNQGVNGKEIMPGGLAAVPTSITNLTAKKALVKAIVVFNSSGGSLNLTIRNGGVTDTIILTKAIGTLDYIVIPSGMVSDADGILFPSGISWLASGSGLIGQVIGTTLI